MPKSTAVLRPNLGLFLGVPAISVPLKGLKDGLNFRVKDGKLSNLNLGWTRFSTFQLDGPVTLIDNFFLRSGAQKLIFGTPTDLYQYDDTLDVVTFLTPRYETGTVTIDSGTPTIVAGLGTLWDGELSPGDMIHVGAAAQTDPLEAWYEIASVDNDTQLTLTTAFVPPAGWPSGAAYTARELFTGSVADTWETEPFLNAQPSGTDLWFATNGGADFIAQWDGSATQVTLLSTLGFRAKHILRHNNMMIYANLIKNTGEALPTSIANSDVTKPEDVTNGLANEFVVHDGVDGIDAIMSLGDNIVMYSARAVVLGQFVGEPIIFIFRKAISNLGPLTGRLVADFGAYHEFIGPDTQYRFDGVRPERVNAHIWREILRTRDPARIGLAFHHFDEENGDLIWSVPLTTDAGAGVVTSPADEAYPAHYLEEVEKVPDWFYPYSKRSFPFTATGFWERGDTITWDQLTGQWQDLNFKWNDQFFSEAFPLNMVGDTDGKVYTLNTAQNADTAALESFVQFGRRPTGSGRERNLVTRIYPFGERFVSADYSLIVTTEMSDHIEGVATISQADNYDLSHAGDHFVSPFRVGRYFSVKFGTPGPSEPWEIGGYDFDAKRGGKR